MFCKFSARISFVLVLITLLLTPAETFAGYDKYLHFSVSFTLYGLSYGITGNEPVSFLVTLGIGLAKELSDLFLQTGVFEYGDLLANFAGTVTATHYCRSLSFRPLLIFWVVF